MSFSFKRASDAFIIMTSSPDALKFVITDIWLQARARIADPEIFKTLIQNFSIPRSVARYPFLRFPIAGPFQVPITQTTFSRTIFRNFKRLVFKNKLRYFRWCASDDSFCLHAYHGPFWSICYKPI